MSEFKARNSDEQWYRDMRYTWMNDDQWACFEMLCDLFHGSHRITGTVKPHGRGIAISVRNGFHAATFDFQGLTEAVIMAHDRCIRFEILPSGPGMLKLAFSKRQGRDGQFYERHPTLEQAIETVRGVPLPADPKVPNDWSGYQALTDIEAVDLALEGFAEDPSGDAGVMVIRAVCKTLLAPALGGE